MNDDLISRDAVLDACSQSINILDAMSRIEDLPSVTPKQRWIPVSERLPEEGIKVLVWERYHSYKRECDVYDYNFGWIYNGNWICEGGGETKVFAWMPLPKPYEPQESEERVMGKCREEISEEISREEIAALLAMGE